MTQATTNAKKMVQGGNKDLLIWSVLIILCLGGGWWWFQNMERSWLPEIRTMERYRKQPMLAASRLLAQRGYRVHEVDSLSLEAIDQAPNGTLIISNNDGTMSREQAQHLLAWVGKGNTLITFPQMRAEFPTPKKEEPVDESEDEKKDKEADVERRRITPFMTPLARRYNPSMQDPIADYLGIASNYRQQIRPNAAVTPSANPASASASQENKTAARTGDQTSPQTDEQEVEDEAYNDEDEHDYDEEIAQLIKDKGLTTYVDSNKVQVQLPHVNRPLQITRTSMAMFNFKNGPRSVYQDQDGSQLRLYQHGKGHIIAMPQNIFVGHSLKWNDNGQFLLDCASLNNNNNKDFTIIKGLRLVSWYELLWQNFMFCILTLTTLILLWSWRGSRRFGLLLPEMNLERRSLLEHIDASARWAWTTANGRQQLVDAARIACQETLRRRAPELLRLAEPEMLEVLASQTGIELASLTQAWRHKAASTPLSFTKQIQLLQQLRSHYER